MSPEKEISRGSLYYNHSQIAPYKIIKEPSGFSRQESEYDPQTIYERLPCSAGTYESSPIAFDDKPVRHMIYILPGTHLKSCS